MTHENTPWLIIVARESKGWTQSELASRIDVSQSKMSKYEGGMLEVTPHDLSLISEATGYTEEFFAQEGGVGGVGTICVHHRKRASLTVARRKVIEARLNIFRLQVPRLLQRIVIDSDRPLPEWDVDKHGGPEAIARELRRYWRMPSGPVRNLAAVIERAGVIVRRTSFATDKSDAVSQREPGYRPVFMLNVGTPGDRERFSLAHELAHVVMHPLMTPTMEQEADRFASELLMPADEIGPELRNLRIETLGPLKLKWRVSMQALIKRASDLGRITERHARTLFSVMSRSGWRLREPVQIEQDQPTVLRDVLMVHMRDHGYSVADLARAAFLRDPAEFRKEFGIDDSPQGLRVVG